MAKTRSVSKAGRLVLLYLLREHELLGNELSQAEIARWLGVNRSTVHKDLRVLDEVLAVYRQLLVTQPWVRWRDGRDESDEVIGGQDEMHRDGATKGEGDGDAGALTSRVPTTETILRAEMTP